jgi:hypothetical protein
MSARNAETRWAWCACVLAVAGCNQIFGNNQVVPLDAFIGEAGLDAAYGVMNVTYAVEATPHDGANPAPPTYTPFDTQVHIGPLDPAHLNLDNLTAPVIAAGTFTVSPDILLGSPRYRLIYSAPDGLDVELQSSVKNANLVVPRIGRLDRVSVASGSDISIMFMGGPNNMLGSWTHGRFITTGLWSIFELGPCCTIGSPFVDYSTFFSMSGTLGAPQASASDTIVFTDSNSDDGGVYDGNHDKVYAYATATLEGFDAGGAPVMPTVSMWKTPAALTSLGVKPPVMHYSQRARTALNDTPADDTIDGPDPLIEGGVIPTVNVTPFTENLPNLGHGTSTNGDLDHVVFAPLSRSNLNPIRFVNPYNGTDALAYQTAVYISGSVKRTFAGTSVTTRTGIQVVALQTEKMVMMPPPDVAFGDGVGLATGIALAPTNTTSSKSLSEIDNVSVTSPTMSAGAQSFDLTFGSDSEDPNAAISDCSVTLYRIDPNLLAPIKRYLVNTLPTVASGSAVIIDSRLFDLVHQYTFGISCYHGHPGANVGDWRAIAFPFAVSTIYSHSFTLMPPLP